MKLKILTFSNKISKKLPKPKRKFMADINYGMLASGSCLLTDISDKFHEPSRKINVVDRLSSHLAKGIPAYALNSYLPSVKKWCPEHPLVHIDDSDVVKPGGYKFESLCLVRDGSESTAKKNIYKKGYEKNFTSINDVTFSAIERAVSFFQYIFLDLCISRFTFSTCQIKLIKRNFNIYMFIGIKFGQ